MERKTPPPLAVPARLAPRPKLDLDALAGVSSARTFYDADSGLSRGILYRYDSGGERAVGQCRVGVDRSMSVLRPTRVCVRDTTYLTRLRKQERAWEPRPAAALSPTGLQARAGGGLLLVGAGRRPRGRRRAAAPRARRR